MVYFFIYSKSVSKDLKRFSNNLKSLLNERFANMDFEQAKEDVMPFIKDKAKLELWSKEFFIEITKKLKSN